MKLYTVISLAVIACAGIGCGPTGKALIGAAQNSEAPPEPPNRVSGGLQYEGYYEHGLYRYAFSGDTADISYLVQDNYGFGDMRIVRGPSGYARINVHTDEEGPRAGQPYVTTYQQEFEKDSLGLPGEFVLAGDIGTFGKFYLEAAALEEATVGREGEWVEIISDTPITVGQSSVRVSYDSCVPGSLGAAGQCDQRPAVLNVESNGLVLRDAEYPDRTFTWMP